MENTNALERLERHPDKVSGAWVFKGTRVPVSTLFENLKDGASIDQFLEMRQFSGRFEEIGRWRSRPGGASLRQGGWYAKRTEGTTEFVLELTG